MIILTTLLAPFIATLILTPVVREAARRYGFLDNPGELKIHRKAMPYLGGVPIFFGFIIGFFASLRMTESGGFDSRYYGIILGSLTVVGFGLLDDLKLLSPISRLFGHISAGVFLILFGIKIQFIPFDFISIPLTIFYVVGACNAMNLLDGMDGLSAGVASIAFLGFIDLAMMQGNHVAALLSMLLIGSTLAFLLYNFPPASIFMGDTGSNFLGFSLAALMILLSSEPFNIRSFIAPVFVMGLPIIDTGFAILRRLRSRQPIFIGDRSHVYDKMVDAGFSRLQTVLICYAIAAAFTGVAVGIGVEVGVGTGVGMGVGAGVTVGVGTGVGTGVGVGVDVAIGVGKGVGV